MMSIYKFPRNHNNKAPQKIIICREFPGPIDRRWKERGANYCEPISFPGFSPTRPYGARETTVRKKNLGTRLTANVVGRDGLAREGEGRRTPHPSFFAKRRLRSQLRRLFAELLGSYQCGLCTQDEEAMQITSFVLFRPLYITGERVSIKTSAKKERHRNKQRRRGLMLSIRPPFITLF